jgi:hypothetical protein
MWAFKLREIIFFAKLKLNIRIDTCCCVHATALLFLWWLVLTKSENDFKIRFENDLEKDKKNLYFSSFPRIRPASPVNPSAHSPFPPAYATFPSPPSLLILGPAQIRAWQLPATSFSLPSSLTAEPCPSAPRLTSRVPCGQGRTASTPRPPSHHGSVRA